MFDAVRTTQRSVKKQTLIAESKQSIESNNKRKVNIITDYFKSQFIRKEVQRFPEIQPTELEKLFTKSEVE